MYVYIYIYIYIYIYTASETERCGKATEERRLEGPFLGAPTPNLPTKTIPTKIIPTTIDLNFPGNSPWSWEFQPSNLRFCLSQTLRNPES